MSNLDLEEAIMFDVRRRTEGNLCQKVFLADSHMLVENRLRKVSFEEFFFAIEALVVKGYLRGGKLYNTYSPYVYLS